jgi:DNA-binding PadR family transcriptional regulator
MVDWARFGEITKEAFDSRLDKEDFQILWMISEKEEASLNALARDPDRPRLDKTNVFRRLRRLEEDWFLTAFQDRKARDYRDYDVKVYRLTPKGQLAAPGVIAFRRQLASIILQSSWYKRPAFWPLPTRDQPSVTKGSVVNQSLASFVQFYSRVFLMAGHNLPLKTMLANSRAIEDLAMFWQEVLIGDLDNMERLAEQHAYVIPPTLRTIKAERMKMAALLGAKWDKYKAVDPRHKSREAVQSNS